MCDNPVNKVIHLTTFTYCYLCNLQTRSCFHCGQLFLAWRIFSSCWTNQVCSDQGCCSLACRNCVRGSSRDLLPLFRVISKQRVTCIMCLFTQLLLLVDKKRCATIYCWVAVSTLFNITVMLHILQVCWDERMIFTSLLVLLALIWFYLHDVEK